MLFAQSVASSEGSRCRSFGTPSSGEPTFFACNNHYFRSALTQGPLNLAQAFECGSLAARARRVAPVLASGSSQTLDHAWALSAQHDSTLGASEAPNHMTPAITAVELAPTGAVRDATQAPCKADLE